MIKFGDYKDTTFDLNYTDKVYKVEHINIIRPGDE